jgi:hypothetical protein
MTRIFSTLVIAIFFIAASHSAFAQGVAAPLTMQGLDQWNTGSVRAHGMGGSGIASGSDIGSMFLNPATLGTLTDPQAMIGGIGGITISQQRQEWAPDRLYAGLSLVFENNFDGIIDTGATKLDRPFDTMGPNWKKTTHYIRPLNAAIAMPWTVFGISGALGVGYNAVSLADNYFQNNNAISPNIGQYRPFPYNRLRGGDSLKVQWYQYAHERDGFISGFTPSVAVNLTNRFSIGASAAFLTSSVDDHDFRMDRGLITLKTYTSSSFSLFTINPVAQQIEQNGTSKFKGTIVTLGGLFTDKAYSVGVTVKLPTTITRDYSYTLTRDTAGVITQTAGSLSQSIKIPAIVAIGFGLRPSRNVALSVDYEIRSYNGADLPATTDSSAYSLQGWLSSSVARAGFEWTPNSWLALRAGYREDVQTYATEGASLTTQPVRGSVYTFGTGLTYGAVQLNLAYEYGVVKVEDAWESNVNYNLTETHTVMADIRYTF